MCGIKVTFGTLPHVYGLLNHRGPDHQCSKSVGRCTFEFSRLAINDTSLEGSQPFEQYGKMMVCNGEIYNHHDLVTGDEQSNSDCAVLLPNIERHGIYETLNKIRGVFAMVYSDGKSIYAARDPIGVRPLFYKKNENGIAFASEVKALKEIDGRIEIFPPGHFYDSLTDEFTCYYNTFWTLNTKPGAHVIRATLENAVRIRVENTDREIGFFLSGGLDSSLVAAIAKKYLKPEQVMRTFSIGTDDSPDVLAAKKMADFLGSKHTVVPFDFKEGIKVLPDVIECLETYDTTTIRASVPMWILSKWISENTDCKVLLSGEGSDELLGGYLYFKNAPSVEEFFMENIRRVKLLHQYDVLRADRCTAAHGLEVRVPFLDRDFVDCVMTMDQNLKMGGIEKKVLRETFQDLIPDEILWRQKDAFSDAVGYSWVDELQKFTREKWGSTVEEFKVVNYPTTPEEMVFRNTFWEKYGFEADHLIKEIWRPKWTSVKDPSARHLK
jgi:asparagine synthase (glutamine-hydrolysing)